MTTREQIIAEAKEADPGFSTGALIPLADSIIGIEAVERLYNIAFAAGAASRDVEIAELVGVLGNVTAHLIAAHSLLSSGGKKAAASDTIFKIMLQDYEKSFEAGRKALAKVRKPT